jgi:hypothetical protein
MTAGRARDQAGPRTDPDLTIPFAAAPGTGYRSAIDPRRDSEIPCAADTVLD